MTMLNGDRLFRHKAVRAVASLALGLTVLLTGCISAPGPKRDQAAVQTSSATEASSTPLYDRKAPAANDGTEAGSTAPAGSASDAATGSAVAAPRGDAFPHGPSYGITYPMLTAPPTTTTTAPPVDAGRLATVMYVGDVLFHSYMLNGGQQEDGSYNYDFTFDLIQPFIEKADIAICDMEGTLDGEPYTGYPLFCAPDAVAHAMAVGGFNMAVAANNHSIDRHMEGVIRTNQVLTDAGLTVIGTRQKPEDPGWCIKEVNGIRIGFTNWTYETIRNEGHRALNGITMSDETAALVDSFTQESPEFEEDLKRMADRVKQMKAAGAEATVVCIHAGTEYDATPNYAQEGVAQAMADAGADLILSCGPHCIQPIRTIQSKTDPAHKLLCYYSVGNCVSDQLYDTGGSNGRAEDGLIAMAQFERQPDGSVTISDAGWLATYCHKDYYAEYKTHNQPCPVREALKDPQAFDAGGYTGLLENSIARTEEVMSKNEVDLPNFRELTWVSDIKADPGPLRDRK